MSRRRRLLRAHRRRNGGGPFACGRVAGPGAGPDRAIAAALAPACAGVERTLHDPRLHRSHGRGRRDAERPGCAASQQPSRSPLPNGSRHWTHLPGPTCAHCQGDGGWRYLSRHSRSSQATYAAVYQPTRPGRCCVRGDQRPVVQQGAAGFEAADRIPLFVANSPSWCRTQWLFMPPLAAVRADARFEALCGSLSD